MLQKPPKTEDSFNENTHHQRSHVNNAKLFLFSSKYQAAASKYAIIHSKDDEAYVLSGTCKGFEKTRNVKILTLSDNCRARKLPLHDFPESKAYCTPAAHRILKKRTVEDETGEEKLGLSIMFLHMVQHGQMRPFVVPTFVRKNLKSLAIQIILLHSGVPVEWYQIAYFTF